MQVLAGRRDIADLARRADMGDPLAADALARRLARYRDLGPLRTRAAAGDRFAVEQLAAALARRPAPSARARPT
ncbi:MAG: hypothetical protein BGP03_12790 [Pseudonocardia sp. 73-21]|nr:MAG: hypothetical protein BGP03_12790 [Pseudonocardia sp. 73-21]